MTGDSSHLPPLSESDRLLRLEITMWGPTGQNGLVGGVADIQKTLEEMRTTEFQALTDKLDRFRNTALAVITTLMLVAGGLVAAFH